MDSVLNVAVIDPPRDTGGVEVSHYLLQVDGGSGVSRLLSLCLFIVCVLMCHSVTKSLE